MKIFIFILILLFILILFGIGYKRNKTYKGFFKFGFISLSILIILELTLFNFRFYESLFFKDINANTDNLVIGKGIEEMPDGSLKVIDSELNYVQIDNFWGHLENIYINFEIVNSEETSEVIYATLGFTDASSRLPIYPQERVFNARKNNSGEILRYHASGNTSWIRIYVNTPEEEDTFIVKDIKFNVVVPFTISLVRPLLIFSLLLVIYIFRPKSSIYNTSLFSKDVKRKIGLALTLQLLFMLGVGQLNTYFTQEQFKESQDKQRMQYQLLTEAFMEGHPYLNEEPSDILKNLKNPYDKRVREEAFKESDEDYIWDVAFYNNKYYVYFGVAPVILYYLPFYAITGTHINTAVCINITMIATVIGVFLLLYHLCKKYYPKVSLGVYLAFTLLFVNACGILYIIGRPDHYSLPIIMAVMFSIYGLFWWLKAKENDLNSKYLFLGSLCMACVAASRPQLLLTSFFAIPLFWEDVKKRELLSLKSYKKTIAFAMPYIVIALLLMWYNYIRFASPFDFGANYNLTTNDMTKRGFVLGRIPLGIYYYLLVPFQFILKFPFLSRFGVSTNYLGTTIYESMTGGFIFVNLLTIFGLLIFKFKNKLENKTLYKLGLLSVIFSLIIIIADTEMAGILPRYICDFGFLMYFATAIVIFHLFTKLDDNKKRFLTKILFACFIFGLIFNLLLVLNDDVFMKSNLFFYFRKLFEFWV